MMKKENLAVRIWDVLYPLLMYYAVIVFVMFVTQSVLGADSKNYMIRQIIATLVALPVVYFGFYKQSYPGMDRTKNQKADIRGLILNSAQIILVAACCGIALNNILSMSPLISMSEGFAQANEDFYAGTFLQEIIGSVILTPILEEMVYRGVIFNRLKRYLGIIPAILLSSLIFGFMHFNIVQFVYAFVLGIMLAVFMEKSGHVYGAMVGHMTVNLISVVRTETGILEATVNKSLFAWGFSVGLFAVGILLLYFLFIRRIKDIYN